MNNRTPSLAAVLLLLCTPAFAADEVEKVDLFTGGEGGYALYRIPGVVVTDKGTVLAYCEARKDSAADWGEIDILLRRSTDGGRTWEKARKVAAPPDDAKKNPAGPARHRDGPGGFTLNNPVAIVDGGIVHLLYCVEYARCFSMRSDDDGATFSAPIEITATFEKFRPQYAWKVIATGPGHGIRLRSGRLLVPVWLSTADGGNPHRPSCVATIYSDDRGSTWQHGDIVVRPPALANPSETAAAELEDGTVMLNIRHESEPRLRAVVTGPDGARSWGKPRLDPALPEPVCMGSIVRGPGGVLLFSNPHNPTGRERRNLTVKLSRDGGATWPVMRTLEAGRSAYSDLAVAPEGTVLCFYERDKRLTMARFAVTWVNRGGR